VKKLARLLITGVVIFAADAVRLCPEYDYLIRRAFAFTENILVDCLCITSC
jgi:hypothetical protein